MKSRIISLFLALVMLFSCMSLSVFAAGGTTESLDEDKQTSEAEIYQSYGVGLPGKQGLSQSNIKKLVGSNGLAVEELTKETALSTPFGLNYANAVFMRLEYGDKENNVLNTYNQSTGKTDPPLLDWRKIEYKEEANGNAYLKWQRPEAYTADGVLLAKAFATQMVDTDGDGTYDTEQFVDQTLQGYVTGGKKMWIYATITDGVAKTATTMQIADFTVANVKAYFALVLVDAEGKAYDPVSGYDGVLYYKGHKTGEYLAENTSTDSTSGMTNYLNNFANNNHDLIGKDYTVSFDFKHYGYSSKLDLFEMRNYTEPGLAKGGYGAIRVASDGRILVYNVAKESYDIQIATIEPNSEEWVNITLYHTPRGLDGIRGNADDNTVHYFINGELKASTTAVLDPSDYLVTLKDGTKLEMNSGSDYTMSMIRLLQASGDADIAAFDNFRVYYGKYLECKHSWCEYSHAHNAEKKTITLSATCEWCGKVDVQEKPIAPFNSLDCAELDALADKSNDFTVIANTDFDTYKSPFKYNDGVFDKNDAGFNEKYGGFNWLMLAEYTEGANKFYRFQRPVVTSWTGGEKISTAVGADGKYTDAALQYYVDNKILSVDGDVIYYIKDRGVFTSDAKGDSSEYLQIMDNLVNNTNNLKNNFAEKHGEAFVITADYRYNSEALKIGAAHTLQLFQLRSYIKSLYTGKNDEYISANIPSIVYNTGVLTIGGHISGKGVSTYALPLDEWVTISVVYTPKGINGTRDVNADGTIAAGSDDNTYHVYINGEYLGSGNIVNPSDVKAFEFEGDKYNYGTDYSNTLYRMVQPNIKYLQADLLDLDNFKIYTDDFLECAHIDVSGKVVLEDGKCVYCENTLSNVCAICDAEVSTSGHVLNKDAILASRNVSLGDEINLNFYLDINDALLAVDGAKIVIEGRDGARRVEALLTDLEKVAEGDNAGKYKASIPLRSIDMASKVVVKVVADGYETEACYKTTVESYLKELKGSTAEALANATLNYGAYAQKYFAILNGDNTLDNNLPNAGITDDVLAATPTFGTDAEIEYEGNGANPFTHVALVLTNKTKINVYFTVGDGASANEAGKALVLHPSDENEGGAYVTLEGRGPKALDERIAVTVIDGDNTATVTLSVNSVLKLILDSTDATENAAYQNLAKAIYLYGKAAEAYVA